MFFESGPLPRAPQAAPPPVPARPPMNIQPLNVHTKVHTPAPPPPAPCMGTHRSELRIMANAFQGAPNALPREIGILAAHSRAPPNALPRGPELLGILNVFFPPPQQAGAGRGPKSAPATPGSPRTPGAKKRIRVS